MSQYELRIHLDRPERTWSPGEDISGRVEVRVLESCEVHRLRLTCEWWANELSCNTWSEVRLLDEEDTWQAGQALHYPFRLEAPPWPCTHRGPPLEVSWRLRAKADHRWGHDSRSGSEEATEDVSLLPEEELPPVEAARSGWKELKLVVPREERQEVKRLAVMMAGVLLGPPLVLFLLSDTSTLDFILAFIHGAVGAVVLLLIWWGFWYRETQGYRVDLWPGAEEVEPGGTLPVRVRLPPTAPPYVRNWALSVVAEQVETRGGGEHLLRTLPVLECSKLAGALGQTLELPAARVRIPRDGSVSVCSRDDEVRWYLKLELRRGGGAACFQKKVPFEVRVPVPSAAAPEERGPKPQGEPLREAPWSTPRPGPWAPAVRGREARREGRVLRDGHDQPLSREDIRRKLEGGLEVVEAAHERYATLVGLLRARQWRRGLHAHLELLREVVGEESAVEEALEALRRRARSEGWPERVEALRLARKVEALRARLGVLAGGCLEADGGAELAAGLERLERRLLEELPPAPSEGERLRLRGGFTPDMSFLGVVGGVGPCLVPFLVEGVIFPSALGLGVAVLLIQGLHQYRHSGRFWLTSERLVWEATGGMPLQIPLHAIRPGGVRLVSGRSVELRLADGRTLHLRFITEARRLVECLG